MDETAESVWMKLRLYDEVGSMRLLDGTPNALWEDVLGPEDHDAEKMNEEAEEDKGSENSDNNEGSARKTTSGSPCAVREPRG